MVTTARVSDGVTRIYLDVDGVILGESAGRVVLARHACKFVEFLLAQYDVYWLTTHCRGDSQAVLDYLGRYAPADFVARLTPIKPTCYEVLKTDALCGDFYWLDDSPLQVELAELRRREQFDRWIEVNTRQRPDDLLFAMSELSASQSKQGRHCVLRER
jgi:hypothetical protein